MRQMLKAVFYCILLGITVSAVHGCSPNPKGDGINVFFESMPNLQDDQIYFKGESVGSIQSSSIGGFRVAKLIVVLKDDFLGKTGNNLAFLARFGRLEAIKLASIGKPLEKETALCGFNSSMELSWFKFKTLIGDRIAAAEKRALALHQRFSTDSAS